MRKNESITGTFDWPLFIVFLMIMFFGLATVYSVAYDPEHSSIFSFSEKYGKQVMWISIALFLGMLVFLIDSDIYRKFAIPIYAFVVVLLVIVLFMPKINGARAWLGIGSMGIQPAEFAKIGTAILLAKYLSIMNIKQQTTQSVLIALGIVLIPMGLILLQPDAGTFVVFTAFIFVLYREGVTFDPIVLLLINLIPGIKFKKTWVGTHFIPIAFVTIFLCVLTLIISKDPYTLDLFPGEEFSGYWRMFIALFIVSLVGFIIMRIIFPKREKNRAALIALIAFVLSTILTATVNVVFEKLASHQKERIELALGIFDDPTGKVKDGADYNRNRAMAAVGSGGFAGKGYRNGFVSSVKTNHVPESETDFIFCPWAEEWGFLGSLVLVCLYLFMMLRIIVIAERQRSIFNRIYAYSVAVILFYHFAINVGMNIGLAPIIGIPLPFFSYGGSSMMSFSIMLFILLKLDSQRRDVLN